MAPTLKSQFGVGEQTIFMRDGSPDTMNQPTFTTCTRHIDKKVEYFCKTCSDTVCARCIFDEHNGHELVQIEDMATSLK